MSATRHFTPGTRVRYVGSPMRLFPSGSGLIFTGGSVTPGEEGTVRWAKYPSFEHVDVAFPSGVGTVATVDLEVVDDER